MSSYTPGRIARMKWRWRLLAVALTSLMYHADPTSAFFLSLSSPTINTLSRSVIMAPRVGSGHYSPTPTSRRCPGDNTAIAMTVQPWMDCTLINSALSSSTINIASSAVVNADNIKVAFNIATFFPQLPWLFLILLPNTDITKKLMGGYEIITICSLVHFFIVVASISQPEGTAPISEFANVFDPSGDPQSAMVGMMQYTNFVSEEWSHVLTWDLFVGRWIWLDGLRRGIFTAHSVLLCNLIGPPGLLLHWLTCILIGKGLPGNETITMDEET